MPEFSVRYGSEASNAISLPQLILTPLYYTNQFPLAYYS